MRNRQRRVVKLARVASIAQKATSAHVARLVIYDKDKCFFQTLDLRARLLAPAGPDKGLDNGLTSLYIELEENQNSEHRELQAAPHEDALRLQHGATLRPWQRPLFAHGLQQTQFIVAWLTHVHLSSTVQGSRTPSERCQRR